MYNTDGPSFEKCESENSSAVLFHASVMHKECTSKQKQLPNEQAMHKRRENMLMLKSEKCAQSNAEIRVDQQFELLFPHLGRGRDSITVVRVGGPSGGLLAIRVAGTSSHLSHLNILARWLTSGCRSIDVHVVGTLHVS